MACGVSDTPGCGHFWRHIYSIPFCGRCCNRTRTPEPSHCTTFKDLDNTLHKSDSCSDGDLFKTDITTNPHMLLDVPWCKAKDYFVKHADINARNKPNAGRTNAITNACCLIRDVKRKLIHVPSIIVCDSAQKMILNHLGVKKIIINVGTNDILVSLLPLMWRFESLLLWEISRGQEASPQHLLTGTLWSREE